MMAIGIGYILVAIFCIGLGFGGGAYLIWYQRRLLVQTMSHQVTEEQQRATNAESAMVRLENQISEARSSLSATQRTLAERNTIVDLQKERIAKLDAELTDIQSRIADFYDLKTEHKLAVEGQRRHQDEISRLKEQLAEAEKWKDSLITQKAEIAAFQRDVKRLELMAKEAESGARKKAEAHEKARRETIEVERKLSEAEAENRYLEEVRTALQNRCDEQAAQLIQVTALAEAEGVAPKRRAEMSAMIKNLASGEIGLDKALKDVSQEVDARIELISSFCQSTQKELGETLETIASIEKEEEKKALFAGISNFLHDYSRSGSTPVSKPGSNGTKGKPAANS